MANSNDKPDANDKLTSQRIDQIYSDVDDLKKTFGSIARSLFDITNESVGELHEKAREYSANWISEFEKEMEEKKNHSRRSWWGCKNHRNESINEPYGAIGSEERSYPAVYQSRDDSLVPLSDKDPIDRFWNSHHSHLHFPWFGGRDHGFFRGSFRAGRTPFGYYSLDTPSIRNYSDCSKKGGDSVWDSQGYWRCLFPNSAVPVDLLKLKNENYPNKILTKEDLENAAREKSIDHSSDVIDLGDKGTYFRKYEEFLNWKSKMYENVRHQRRTRRHHRPVEIQENSKALEISSAPQEDKQVVSSSIQTSYSSDPESNEVKMNEIRTEHFSDGTSLTKTISRSKPLGADDWVNVVENVDRGHADDKNSGWFWNK